MTRPGRVWGFTGRFVVGLGARAGLVVIGGWSVVTLTFVVARVLPSDPVALLIGPHANAEVARAVSEQLGLDQPLHVQYVGYLLGVVRGDLGSSIRTGQPVLSDLRARLPATLELVAASTLIGIGVGVPLGVITAVTRGRWPDYVGRVAALLGVATPSFWLGIVLVYVLYFQFRLAPAPVGRLPLGAPPPPVVSGLLVVDSTLAGRLDLLGAAVAQLLLPSITLGCVLFGPLARVVRAGLLEALVTDYVRTAHAKGLPRHRVIVGHALRNALLPAVTLVATLCGNLLGGAVLVETVFSWPGLGRYAVEAIQVSDYAALQGFVLLTGGIYVVVYQLVDAAYVLLDPRAGAATSGQ